MKLGMKIITILVIMLFAITALTGSVNAAGSMKASKSSVTVGQNVSITVSFGSKVSAAQFKLSFDSSKFDFVSCSKGDYNKSTTRYTYLGMSTEPDLGSVTFTFKAKATGSGGFSLSGGMAQTSAGKTSLSGMSSTVKIEAAKSNTTTKKPTTTTKKPTTSKKDDKDTQETPKEPEVIDKSGLDSVKQLLVGKVETDYTEESWKALQDAIAAAESAETNAAYDEVKEKLNIEGLVPVTFEKEELNKVLRDLIGKVETDYTEESWKALQEAINIAESAELKSEYDSVKDKLTIDGLMLDEKGLFEGIINSSCGHGRIIIVLAAIIVVLLIIIIILGASLSKAKDAASLGRRIK